MYIYRVVTSGKRVLKKTRNTDDQWEVSLAFCKQSPKKPSQHEKEVRAPLNIIPRWKDSCQTRIENNTGQPFWWRFHPADFKNLHWLQGIDLCKKHQPRLGFIQRKHWGSHGHCICLWSVTTEPGSPVVHPRRLWPILWTTIPRITTKDLRPYCTGNNTLFPQFLSNDTNTPPTCLC